MNLSFSAQPGQQFTQPLPFGPRKRCKTGHEACRPHVYFGRINSRAEWPWLGELLARLGRKAFRISLRSNVGTNSDVMFLRIRGFPLRCNPRLRSAIASRSRLLFQTSRFHRQVSLPALRGTPHGRLPVTTNERLPPALVKQKFGLTCKSGPVIQ